MESFRDKARACGLAFLVHLGVVAVLLIGLFWTQSEVKPISLPGPIIEAELVGISAAPKPRAAVKPRPALPKPLETPPEPVKPPEPKPTPPSQAQRNDQTEREKVAEMAQQKADQAQRAEEERKRQEQILLEQQQHDERERQKQLEDIKRQHADAEKKLKLEKEKLAQLQDLQKPKPILHPTTQPVPEADEAKTGTNGQDDSLWAQYQAAITNAVTTNWLRPDSTQPGLHCMLRIVQIPGGDVIGVEIGNPCNADPMTRSSIEQAVKRAAPLPYKGFEKEFRRDINFNFTYDG